MEREKMIKIGFVFFISIAAFFLIRPIFSVTNNKTKIVFFGLGKADSIYIENGSKNMLIDTGLRSQKESLLLRLDALKVKKIDYLILTHPDKDHIGSASYILENLKVDKLIQSPLIKNTKAEGRIDKVLKEKEIKTIRPNSDFKFDLGSLKVTIFVPKKDYYKKDNDYSLVTLIEDDDLNYLFAGDAEKELLKETIELDLPPIDIYKVAHHGRLNSKSQEMIKKISPRYSIITNFEGQGEVDDLLRKEDSKIMYVFEKDLTFFSDGKKLKFN